MSEPTMTDDRVTFLRARFDEDEQRAPDIHTKGCGAHVEHAWGYEFHPEWCDCGEPARVLREVKAKRRIVGQYGGALVLEDWPTCSALSDVLVELALLHVDHSDYQETWTP